MAAEKDMTAHDLILAIDQGTSSTRALVFNRAGAVLAVAQQELRQHYPTEGWVEHDPEEIWQATVAVCREAVAGLKPDRLAAAGITNQRETFVMWDRATGRAVHNAIVWQDRRGAALCRQLEAQGHLATVKGRTGLVLDSYFSASKLAWLLDQDATFRSRAKKGDLAFGTIDSFLLWRLTGGRTHATDATNAARTMLYDIHAQRWSPELCDLFNVPIELLPEVRDCAAEYGRIEPSILGTAVPITGVAGDQQAALVGQGCIAPGAAKATYGTGCFVLTNEGPIAPQNDSLLTTVAYRLDGKTTFATEGSVFNAGTAITWLRDGLGLIAEGRETEDLAAALANNGGVYFVPSFTGLGAPYWEPEARGLIYGLGRETTKAHIVRAALEAAAYQTEDLVRIAPTRPTTIRIDGGMAENNWFAQFLADVLDASVERPAVTETTARGAALLAGLGAGLYDSLTDAAATWRSDRRFSPNMADDHRKRLLRGWAGAVKQVRAGYA